MNKTALRTFAISARKKLTQAVADGCLRCGVAAGGASFPTDAACKEERRWLLGRIRLLAGGDGFAKGYERFVEETACGWFLRITAIRFMEANGYLPFRILSSETPGKPEPLLSRALEADGLSARERACLEEALAEGRMDDAFQLLFLHQCNALAIPLPGLFEPLPAEAGLFLSLPHADPDGVLSRLLAIPEEAFNVSRGGQVEIVGWLYQYYQSELKDEAFALLEHNVKLTQERIPAATQLFTPDWIVRFLVENSLGRLWLEYLNAAHVPQAVAQLRGGWTYYLEEAPQEEAVRARLESLRRGCRGLRPEEIRLIDPCMGAGHILAYAFDVLMQIYRSCGYAAQDAARLIAENNLFGLDIDERACRLAAFTLMMKGRQYDPRFLERGIKLNLVCIRQSDTAGRDLLNRLDGKVRDDATALLDTFRDAQTLGSLLIMPDLDWNALEAACSARRDLRDAFLPLIRQGRLLVQRYDVVVTNPPYMGAAGMNGALSAYLKAHFPDGRADLFAAFIERCALFTAPGRYQAMLTQHAWMFLSRFERLRGKLLSSDLVCVAHLGARAFDGIGGEVVQAAAFVRRNAGTGGYEGLYLRLVDAAGEDRKRGAFLSGEGRYFARQERFAAIPGGPMAYWESERLLLGFQNPPLSRFAKLRQGLATGDNARFVRLWSEIDISRCGFGLLSCAEATQTDKVWFPYNKGGEFRKWYGNDGYVVNWARDGAEIRAFRDERGRPRSRAQNTEFYFRESVTWSKVTGGNIAFRYKPVGHIFDVAGTSMFFGNDLRDYLLGFCNSCVALRFANALSPTLNYEVGHVAQIPVKLAPQRRAEIEVLVRECVALSRADWDAFETSWDFSRHPLLPRPGETSLRAAFARWERECKERFCRLRANEEALNRIFIEIYGLEGELTPEVTERDVTVCRADLARDIRSFLSYAVGCMFGRYSLDAPGLAFAGGAWDETKYTTFRPVADNILPMMDGPYFPGDIVGRFEEFVTAVYGEATLADNLAFIAAALGGKGSPLEAIRTYFLKEFYADHLRVYQKRPIYWLFDSGVENGFKALVYLHRYDPDTLTRIRTEYLNRTRVAITYAMRLNIAPVHGGAARRREKLARQLAQMQAYGQALSSIALRYIQLDLDDGVRANYAKFQGVEFADANGNAQSTDLLAGI